MSFSFSEEVNFIVAIFDEVDKSDFLVVASSPVTNEAVGAVVAVDVVLRASFARGYPLDGAVEEGLLYLHPVGTRVGHYALEAVHLPHVPRDDVGNVVERFEHGLLAELGFVVLDEGDEHRLAGY